ncbi:MAG: hypothetical protein ACLTXT_07525, partial [Ruminococcus callidus]
CAGQKKQRDFKTGRNYFCGIIQNVEVGVMTKEELQDVILSFTNDVLLDYPEHDTIFINPFHIHKFLLSYEDIEKVYDSIGALMTDKIYNGKSLSEIAPLLTLL